MFVQKKPFVVYVLRNEAEQMYIGYTGQFEKRMMYHNGVLPSKSTSFTKKNKRGDWLLTYTEEFDSKAEAMKREKQLKSFQGRQFLRGEVLNA